MKRGDMVVARDSHNLWHEESDGMLHPFSPHFWILSTDICLLLDLQLKVNAYYPKDWLPYCKILTPEGKIGWVSKEFLSTVQKS